MRKRIHRSENSKDKKKRLSRKAAENDSMHVRSIVSSFSNGQIQRMLEDNRNTIFRKMQDPTARAIFNNSIQPKLEISSPNDPAEHQADKVAEGVMKGDPAVSQAALSQNVTSEISAKGEGGVMQTTDGFDSKLQGTKGQGQKLDTIQRKELEQHTGTNLSGVNVHTNSNASEMSESINAKAFTHGQDIYFKEGNYNPSSNEGKSLLAHEIAHTVQQQGSVKRKIQRQTKKKPKPKAKDALNNAKQPAKKVVPYIIEKDVSVNVHAVVIADMEKNLEPVYSAIFPELKQDQEVNVTTAIGKEKKGTYIIVFYDDKGKAIEGSGQVLHPEKGKEIIVKTVGELTRMRAKYKNYDALIAKQKELELKPDLKGKTYFYVIKSGDVPDTLAGETLETQNNQTTKNHLRDKIVEINEGIKYGTIGNGIILLKNWVDPNIGSLSTKPKDINNLTQEVKEAAAVIYAEQMGTGPRAQEQQKYVWYSILARITSPEHPPGMIAVLSEDLQYTSYGNSNFNKALKELNANKRSAAVENIAKMILANWSVTIPATAGKSYFHWWASDMDSYYNKTKATSKDGKEKEAAAKRAKYAFGSTISIEQGWLYKILSESGELEGSMYIYP
jgi:hypothetical protein